MYAVGEEDGHYVIEVKFDLMAFVREKKTFEELVELMGEDDATILWMPIFDLGQPNSLGRVFLMDEHGQTVRAVPEEYLKEHGYLALNHDCGFTVFAGTQDRAQEIYDQISESNE